MKRVLIIINLIVLCSCAPRIYPPGNAVDSPRLGERGFVTIDGMVLPLRAWLPAEDEPKAAVIALHGFNDYSNFFSEPGSYLSQEGIACYAYDQRGFGLAPNIGLWAGTQAYVDDIKQMARLVKEHHPGIPVYLLGESMGGAVVMVAASDDDPPAVDGIILAAPAVWGRGTMPWYQRLTLWLTAHTVPWMTLTGEGLGIKPSDNIEMLRALGADPLVIKETRVETIHGLVDLMDKAMEQSTRISLSALVLYGERDEVIPKEPTYRMLRNLPNNGLWRVAIYENGYHMLLRDLQAEKLWRDIVVWIDSRVTQFPSGADIRAHSMLLGMETGNN